MKKAKKIKALAAIALFAVIAGAATVWTIWGNTALMAEQFTISGDDLPAGFSGFRIAHISDLHNAEFGENNGELLQIISNAEPDMIVITGDLIDADRTDLNLAVSFVKAAAAIAPTYYVPGNHEARISDYDRLREGLAAAGAAVLEDQATVVEHNGAIITLVGLADPSFTIQNDVFGEISAMIAVKLTRLLEDTDGFTLVLSHRPELFDAYVSCGADLVLSGHAHGGQFRLPFVGGLIAPDQGLFPRYDAGLYTHDSTKMIVSRGLGNSVIPIRFNDRPEIVVVTLSAGGSILS